MALEKTISANGSHGRHTFTLKVTEDSTNSTSSFIGYTFKLSPIQTGWRWSGWGSKIYYEINIKYRKQGESQDTVLKYTGNIPSYDGSSVVTLKSGTNIEIPHDPDGTRTINISFKVTDTANGKNSSGQYYTPGNANANDNFVLSVLHTPPTISNVAIQEINATLTTLGITDNKIVQFLSQKKFTITSTLYDSATVSSCSIYHNNVLIGTANSNEVTVDFSTVSELMTTETGGVNYVGLMVSVTDSLGGISNTLVNYETIKYFKPVVEKTSTSIKRKTGSGVVLTDNKANLNFVGSAYKENDTIGNNNTPVVEYKIWNTTEPVSYTTVSSTITDNSVTVTNYELSNVVFTNVYNYKIRIRDSFGNIDEKEGSIPTGQSVWTEYKDRVNFLKAQVGGVDVLTEDYTIINSTETPIGVWIDDSIIYRKVINFGSLPATSSAIYVDHNISNLNEIVGIKAIGFDGSDTYYPIPFSASQFMYGSTSLSIRVNSTQIGIASSGTSFSGHTAIVVLEYTKSNS